MTVAVFKLRPAWVPKQNIKLEFTFKHHPIIASLLAETSSAVSVLVPDFEP
jgi:hypothetical protein